MFSSLNDITEAVIGAAIEVHQELAPGLLESSYQLCLAHELRIRDIPFVAERPLPLNYKGLLLDCGYRVDFLAMETVVIEIKSIKAIERIHEAQLLTYLKLGKWPAGLLLNFNVLTLKDGIKRRLPTLPG